MELRLIACQNVDDFDKCFVSMVSEEAEEVEEIASKLRYLAEIFLWVRVTDY